MPDNKDMPKSEKTLEEKIDDLKYKMDELEARLSKIEKTVEEMHYLAVKACSKGTVVRLSKN